MEQALEGGGRSLVQSSGAQCTGSGGRTKSTSRGREVIERATGELAGAARKKREAAAGCRGSGSGSGSGGRRVACTARKCSFFEVSGIFPELTTGSRPTDRPTDRHLSASVRLSPPRLDSTQLAVGCSTESDVRHSDGSKLECFN